MERGVLLSAIIRCAGLPLPNRRQPPRFTRCVPPANCLRRAIRLAIAVAALAGWLALGSPGWAQSRGHPLFPGSDPPADDSAAKLTDYREERYDFSRSEALLRTPLPEPLPPPESDPAAPQPSPQGRRFLPQPGDHNAPQPDGSTPDDPSQLPPGTRPGVFQKAILESTWLAPGHGQDVGITDVEVKAVFGFPCPTRQSPLVVTPGWAVHLFDGPALGDLPPGVYDAYMQFRWLARPWPRLGIDLAVTPGWYSDLKQGSGEALRITGHGAGLYTCSQTLKLAFGVAYLDRRDVPVLPIGGIIWTPAEEVAFELVAPRPRIAHRLEFLPGAEAGIEHWLYLAGELGGGTWAIRRADGTRDLLTARDYRLLVGLERKAPGRLNSLLEAGYVFGRRFEYKQPTPDLHPDDTFLLRAGLSY